MAKKKSTEQQIIDDLRDAYKKKGVHSVSASFLWESSTDVDEWISTGSFLLDVAISNRANGGIPVGRLTEISGQEGVGKTLLAANIIANTQKMGGIGIMIDTEHAASTEVLEACGVDLTKLVYVQASSIESVFETFDTIINSINESGSDKLITVVWDSVAGTSALAEIEGTYEQQTIGLGARVIGKGLRKSIGLISTKRVALVFVNQLRTRIGVAFGDKYMTPGGMAIPFHASVRLRLNHFAKVKDKSKQEIGKVVKAHVHKNKIAPPFRTAYYGLTWGTKLGAWIIEHDQVFETALEYGIIEKVTPQKYKFNIKGLDTEFKKTAFEDVWNEPAIQGAIKKELLEKLIVTQDNIASTDVEFALPEGEE